jgi:hypothetical protein
VEGIESRLGVPSPVPTEAGAPADGEAAERPMTQTQISRRAAIGGALAGLGGLGSLLLFPGQALAKQAVVHDPFVIFLKGPYRPVAHPPADNLGLSTVNLSDGSYSTTKIYPVTGIPGFNDPKVAIGAFYVQFVGDLCAYRLPGGTLAMRFTVIEDDFPVTNKGGAVVPDGNGGTFQEGTLELTILEATGWYRDFAGGHNHMQDRLQFLAPGDGSGGAVEHCLCNISKP